MGRASFFSIILLIFFMMGVGCGSSSSSPLYEKTFFKDNNSGCEFLPSAGEFADFSKLTHQQISLGVFSKEFNRAHLDGILKASGDSSLEYVGRDSVEIYKVPSSEPGCNYFSRAKLIPDEWREFWDAAAAVLGIYVAPTTSQLQKMNLEKPVVIIREQAGRWVLVHEYLHHLFSVESLKKGYNDQKLKSQREALLEKYLHLSFDEFSGFSMLNEVVQTFTQFSDVTDQLLVHYFYEEIAVESLLRKEFDKQTLKFVGHHDYDNAAWYIHYSADNARRMTDVLTENLNSIARYVEQSTAMTGKQKSGLQIKIAQTLDHINQRNQELDKILEVTPKVSLQVATGVLALTAVSQTLPAVCTHSQEEEKFIDHAVRALTRSL